MLKTDLNDFIPPSLAECHGDPEAKAVDLGPITTCSSCGTLTLISFMSVLRNNPDMRVSLETTDSGDAYEVVAHGSDTTYKLSVDHLTAPMHLALMQEVQRTLGGRLGARITFDRLHGTVVFEPARNGTAARTGTDYSEWLDDVFSYHAPSEADIEKYTAIREAAKSFAAEVIERCPESADRTAALRKIREAVMTANASIALAK